MLWKALDVESHFLLHCKKMNIKDKVIKSLSKILTQITVNQTLSLRTQCNITLVIHT